VAMDAVALIRGDNRAATVLLLSRADQIYAAPVILTYFSLPSPSIISAKKSITASVRPYARSGIGRAECACHNV